MATGTVTVRLDLDHDNTYETDISAYVDWEQSLVAQGLGRQSQMDRAGEQSLTIHVDNADGRFSPQNASGPYFPAIRDKPFGVQVQVTFNAVTYDFFTGRVWDIRPKRSRTDQKAYMECVDRSAAFNRAEITLPFMLDIYTGSMMHRIVDLFEGGLIANTRFATDLSGYAAVSAATNTRVTSGNRLEGESAMETDAANTDGWQRVLSGEESAQNTKYTYAVYVFRDPAAAAATTVELLAFRGINQVATSGNVILAEGRWNRIEIAADWPNLAGTRALILLNKSGAAATFRTGAVHGVVRARAIERRIDRGTSILRNNAYRRRTAAEAAEEVRANEINGLFYFDADGAAVFEDAHHRWERAESTAPQAVFDSTFADLEYSDTASNRVSEVKLDYAEWEVGVPGTQVWGLFPVPVDIPPKIGSVKGRLVVPIDFNGGLVREMIRPVVNEDYFVSTAADGSGSDAAADITLDWEPFGGGAHAVFESDSTSSTYLLSFTQRGTSVRQGTARQAAMATPSDPPRENLPLAYAYTLNADANRIQGAAEYYAKKYGPPNESITMQLSAPWPQASEARHLANATQILTRRISDRITVTDDKLPWNTHVNGDYYIESIDRGLEGEELRATYKLSPVDIDYLVYDGGSYDAGEIYAPF